MMGMSVTVSEMAVVCRSSRITGSSSASATARRSRSSCVSSFRACAKIRRIIWSSLFLRADLAALAGLLHNADEYIFERKTPFPRAEHVDSSGFELLGVLANACFHIRRR